MWESVLWGLVGGTIIFVTKELYKAWRNWPALVRQERRDAVEEWKALYIAAQTRLDIVQSQLYDIRNAAEAAKRLAHESADRIAVVESKINGGSGAAAH